MCVCVCTDCIYTHPHTASFTNESLHQATTSRLRIRRCLPKSVLTVWCHESPVSEVPSPTGPRKSPLVRHAQISSRHYCQGVSVSMSFDSVAM